ncbi:uncharacterized protein [Cardiocondyla obscurior]|uniref:uncharacterized protein n=1 Tax=Cardiocondyla obscurior TaxID=286306 RepID=UPI0039656348
MRKLMKPILKQIMTQTRKVLVTGHGKHSDNNDETSDISNQKWMTFLVRYVDPETLDSRSQLVKLINIDAKNSSAEKLFDAFLNEMWKLQIPFQNIIAMSCDNAHVMVGKYSSFKTKLQKFCHKLLTFSCPCHFAALIAHNACSKIPEHCEEFVQKVATFINSSPKRSVIFEEFAISFQETNRKILKFNRESSFRDVPYIVSTFGGYDEKDLKKEWFALYKDFSESDKDLLAILEFDELWKKIFKSHRYPNLKSVLNAVRSLPNSNADSERIFSFYQI